MTITEEHVKQAMLNVMVKRLEEAGYIVTPPSERKRYRLGPITVYSDPVNFGIGWTPKGGRHGQQRRD